MEGFGLREGTGVTNVDDLGRPEILVSKVEVLGLGDGASEGASRTGAVGCFFPMLLVGLAVWVLGTGAGEICFGGIAEGATNIVATPFLTVLSDDSWLSSRTKPRSILENMAAVKSPIESRDSASFSPCLCTELVESTDVLGVELC